MIFVLSFHRSGTQSVHTFLRQAGYRAIHNPSGMSKMNFQSEWIGHERDLEYIFSSLLSHTIPEYDAISDNPMAALHVQAYKRFPDAKFILSIRDPKKWISSVRKHIGDRKLVPAEKVQYWRYLDFNPEKLTEIDDQTLHSIYKMHQKEALDFFTGNNAIDQLCVIDLDKDIEFNGCILSTFLHLPSTIQLPHIDEKK